MVFYKVIDEGGLIRFEEKGGARITVRLERKMGHILSIYVPEEEREKGMGARLLAIAEKECLERGMIGMEAAFADEKQDIKAFLSALGYQVETGPDVVSFTQKALLGKRSVKAMMMVDCPGAVFKRLDEMDQDEIKEMYKIIDQNKARLAWDDICTYSGMLSGVVMDERNRPQVVVLSYLRKSVLTIDWVGVMPGADPDLVALAFSRIMMNLVENSSVTAVSQIVGIPANPVVKKILEKIKENGAEPQKDCGTYYAKKALSPADYDDVELTEEELIEDMEILWHKEVYTVKNQPAIGWKVCWMHHK